MTIVRIQLAENSQSEREKVFTRFPDLFKNNETLKDTEINVPVTTGTLSSQTKSQTGTTTPTSRSGARTRKTDRNRTFGEKQCGWRFFCVTDGNNGKK